MYCATGCRSGLPLVMKMPLVTLVVGGMVCYPIDGRWVIVIIVVMVFVMGMCATPNCPTAK